MSEHDSNAPEGQDPLKNLKAELDRKLGNADAKLSQLQEANAALLAKLERLSTPTAPTKEASLTDLLYNDPEKYAQMVERRAEEKALAQMQRQQAQMVKTSTTISELQNEFPELSDSGHELTKKAVEVYNSLPEEERTTSLAYKMAVKAAALDLGYKPRSKRPVDEEPSIGSGYGRGAPRKSNKLDTDTELAAQIFGIDTSDPKVKERLIKKSQRDWNKYKPVKE